MATSPSSAGVTWAERVVDTWRRHGTAILAVAAAHAAVTATLRLQAAFAAADIVADETGRLYGPIDLMYRYEEVHRWFAGQPVYGALENADYPPAAYAVLWPLLRGTPADTETLFLVTAALSLVAIGALAAWQSSARGVAERSFVALFIAAASAAQLSIWIGQVGLHVVALLLLGAALVCTRAETASWGRDLLLTGVIVAALVKPTVAAPIVLAFVIIEGRWRLALLAGGVYAALTLFAASFQDPPLLTLFAQWLGQDGKVMFGEGSANLNLWMWQLGLGAWKLQASVVVLAGTAAWLWRHRRADPWALVGVSALVARLWIHHRAHDDVMFILIAVALFRLARSPLAVRAEARVAAGLALAALYAAVQVPMGWITVHAAPEVWTAAEALRVSALVSAFVVLVWQTHATDTPRTQLPHDAPALALRSTARAQ